VLDGLLSLVTRHLRIAVAGETYYYAVYCRELIVNIVMQLLGHTIIISISLSAASRVQRYYAASVITIMLSTIVS
jgi:protein involved in sex pheromone biosynthesis